MTERSADSHSEENTPSKQQQLGSLLANRRQALNLSQQQVAEKLNLRVSIVKHIEEDDHEQIKLPKAYISGYIKNYAKLLELSNDSLIAFSEELRVNEPEKNAQSKQNTNDESSSNSMIFGVIALVLGAVIATYFFVQSKSLPTETQSESSSNAVETIEAVETTETTTTGN